MLWHGSCVLAHTPPGPTGPHLLRACLYDLGDLLVGYTGEGIGVGVDLAPPILDIKVKGSQLRHPLLAHSIQLCRGYDILERVIVCQDRESMCLEVVIEFVCHHPF